MPQGRYYDPTRDADVDHALDGGMDVRALVTTVLTLSSSRGYPAAELIRQDGSTLTFGTDGEWAVLVWVDSLGDSHRSVGDDRDGHLTYDYFGSWSEAPSDCQVPIEHAVCAMEQFARDGTPVTEQVTFQPE